MNVDILSLRACLLFFAVEVGPPATYRVQPFKSGAAGIGVYSLISIVSDELCALNTHVPYIYSLFRFYYSCETLPRLVELEKSPWQNSHLRTI